MHKPMAMDTGLRWTRSLLGRSSELALVLGLHLTLALMLASTSLRPPAAQELARLDLRIIEERPAAREKPRKPTPLPPKPAPRPVQPVQSGPPVQPVLSAPPAVMMAAKSDAREAASTFALPVQAVAMPVSNPSTVPAPAPAPAPAPVPVTPARFDADYLHNPAPAYPRAARRHGDQGRVLLKVLVNAQGTASSVQLEASSGSARLDQAAQETVRQWRFVPARRGSETINDWVLVPVVFRLDS